jgi:Fe(3+) dicitrate transport protein
MRVFLASLLIIVSIVTAFGQQRGSISGRLTDPSGAVIVRARVKLVERSGRFERAVSTDTEGVFRFDGLVNGNYVITVSDAGFSPVLQAVSLAAGEDRRMDISLELAVLTEEVAVSTPRIAQVPETIPGSVSVLDVGTLEVSRVFTTSEALRKIPGVNVRDEEGFGLRPNIGIRGINPTRSTKVLLLEDGIPLSYAPYGDNASYYHPPIDRFEAVEVVKGAGQVLYGPVTVSGVVNYLTPVPPSTPSGSLTLFGGYRDYFNGHLNWGGTWGDTGFLVDVMRKQGEGARENLRHGLNDVNLKLVTALGTRQSLTLRGNYYSEDSNVTYSGLREDEYRENPRQNPFRNDFFYGGRHGASATHSIILNERAIVTTNIYASIFNRDWWRQSSNSSQRPNDSADPACGGMINLNTTCGNEGRLRGYTTWGVEPHVRFNHGLFGIKNDSDFGFRVHFENQDRRQENGTRPMSRTGTIVESNVRKNQAYSVFLQNRFVAGKFALTPGIRVERIDYERTNNLADGGAGVTGETDLTQFVPGLGLAYSVRDDLTVFAGAHRGFAPPRTEDIIDNNTGGAVDLDPELSWNYEVGLRGRLHPAAGVEATFFRMDYENQIVPASLAGGVGTLVTNGGQTLHQGIEFAGRFDLGTALGVRHNVYVRSAYTYVPVSKFTGTRFSSVGGFSTVSVTNNRLPYAPRHLVNTIVGYGHPRGIDALIEAVYVGEQFGDDLNTVEPTPDGQRGLIPGNTTWNAVFNYNIETLRTTVFVTVKNLLDRTFIVDQTRGILPNSPRLLQAGLKVQF